jgi:hypothetical protein
MPGIDDEPPMFKSSELFSTSMQHTRICAYVPYLSPVSTQLVRPFPRFQMTILTRYYSIRINELIEVGRGAF